MKKSVIKPSSLHQVVSKEKFPSLRIDPQTLLAFPYGTADKNPLLKWKTRPVLESDLDSLYSQVFGDSAAMRNYEKGIPFLREELNRRFQIWNEISNQKFARGAFLVTDWDGHCIGYIIILETPERGVARIAQAYDLHYSSQGLACSIIRCFVEQWGPWVSHVGKGLLGRPDIIDKFRCFRGSELKKFYAMVFPSNPGAWTIVDRLGFQRAKDVVAEKKQNIILNYYDPRVSRNDKETFLKKLCEMEENLFDYFKKNSEFEIDKKYLMIAPEGKERTVSYYSEFSRFIWHFEYPLD